jgi:hypothetical protein
VRAEQIAADETLLGDVWMGSPIKHGCTTHWNGESNTRGDVINNGFGCDWDVERFALLVLSALGNNFDIARKHSICFPKTDFSVKTGRQLNGLSYPPRAEWSYVEQQKTCWTGWTDRATR